MQTTQVLPAQRAVRRDLAAVGVASLAVALIGVAAVFLAYRATTPSDGAVAGYVTSRWTAQGMEVAAVDDATTALRPGDVVTGIAGTSLDAWIGRWLDPTAGRPSLTSGTELEYQVLRDGTARSVAVELRPYRLTDVLLANWGTVLWITLMVLVAGYLFLRRPGETATRALLVAAAAIFGSSIPWMLGVGPPDLVKGALGPSLFLTASFPLYLLFWAATLHFGTVFPRPILAGRGQRALALGIYAVPLGAQLAWSGGSALAATSITGWIGGWTVVQLLLVPVIIVALLGVSAFQWRRADADDRLRLRWIMAAAALAAAMVLAGWYLPAALIGTSILPWSAVGMAGIPFPLAIGLAVRRGRLFGIETILHRSLVYGGLTAGVVLVYAASAVLVNALLGGEGPYAVQLLAAGAAALLALPIRDRLQRGVSHLLYGDRDEPYRAVARLGRQIERSIEPGAVLPMVAETVAEALRLPYVAIELRRNGDAVVAAAHGTPRPGATRVPLTHQGEEIGWLVAAPRDPDEPFSPADRALLADLARQAGAAAYAVRLTADLRRSRQQLVSAREEERRRLRRDLHDGVGPALAGSLLKIEAARARGDGALDPLLEELADETRRAIEDVRRLAYDLRPPVLDQLGLADALRQEANRYAAGRLEVAVSAPDPMPELAAAVEVAAYRIASEALANVAHHARARHAWLELGVNDDAFWVEVRDDGSGAPGAPRSGVGMSSMRERAEELGGALEVSGAAEGGLRVRATIPLSGELGHA